MDRPALWHINLNLNIYSIFYILFILFRESGSSEILRPRGVSISKASLYVPERDFTCFDGSLTIPFTFVNDDYCDCQDGSDEPGTPACPNGTFHCTNAGHKPINIPSSRVNDGICDCCDTSDEYGSKANCINNCYDLGKAARVEAQKKAEIAKLGSEMREQLSKQGKKLRQEKQERLIQLEKDKEEAEQLKLEKEKLKLAAEELENKALEKYKEAEEAERMLKQEEEKKENEREAFEHFQRLDSNNNEKLEKSEIITQQVFDQNKDGVVSEDEVKFFFDSHEELNWDDFLASGWSRMRPFLLMNSGMFQRPQVEPPEYSEGQQYEETTPEEEAHEDANKDEEDVRDDEDEDKPFDQENDEVDGDLHEEEETPVEEKPEAGSKYDDETNQLIEEATRARSEFEEADRAARDVEREIRQLHESLEKDYGVDDEFTPLDGECFEYTDSEYVYKLCPFDQATQRSKSGGSETRLGTWSSWTGPENNKYERMMYDKGQSCWNGPQRSTEVQLICGTENALTAVSEPNRCEYVFDFVTPSICQSSETRSETHDEL